MCCRQETFIIKEAENSRPSGRFVNVVNLAGISTFFFLLADPPIYFVPVLRTVDNSVYPKLSHPCTLQQLKTPGSQTRVDRIESPVMNSALAGPMSPLQAKSFYKEWHSPSNGKDVKRSDPDRGMERIGRSEFSGIDYQLLISPLSLPHLDV